MRPLCHEELADIWADIMEETGATVRRELFVQDMSSPQREAWLDVAAYGVPELAGLLFDVTVRHPRAARYIPAAANVDGEAVRRADAEKHEKYPARSGYRVVTLGHETWGRLGEPAEETLSLCAAVANRRDHRRGRLPGDRLRRWRAALDGALQRGVARQLAAAALGFHGKAASRRGVLDMTALETRGSRTPRWRA